MQNKYSAGFCKSYDATLIFCDALRTPDTIAQLCCPLQHQTTIMITSWDSLPLILLSDNESLLFHFILAGLASALLSAT